MSKLLKTALVTAAACIAFSTIASPAHAGQKTDCTVYNNELWAAPVGMLRMHCAGDSSEYRAYHISSNLDSCPVTATLEEVKMWNAMVTAAYLSGRKLVLNWTQVTCAMGSQIKTLTSVWLN